MEQNLFNPHQVDELRVDLAQDDFLELVDALENDMQYALQAMKKGIEQDDLTVITDAAHLMKGSCANLAAQRAADEATEIEGFAKRKNHDVDYADMVAALSHTCEATLSALRDYAKR